MSTPRVLRDDSLALPETAVQATVRHAPTAREIDRAALGGLDVHSVGLGIEDAAVALAALQTLEHPS